MARIGVEFGGALITLLYYLVCLHDARRRAANCNQRLRFVEKVKLFFIMNKVIMDKVITR